MKNWNFFRKVRPCLCLIICMGLMSCSVLKPISAAQKLKTYRITAVVLSRGNQGDLATALEGVFITQIDPLEVKEGLNNQFVQLCLSVKVNDDVALNRLLSKLQLSGFQITSTNLQD
jgi:hypothetical protein